MNHKILEYCPILIHKKYKFCSSIILFIEPNKMNNFFIQCIFLHVFLKKGLPL